MWQDVLHVEEPRFRLGYRADIEGLRAVAVSLVVAAHAGVSWLQGGFIGVDVFFVLSGYLITALLLQEYNATRGLRLLAFYARRLRRLLPALLVMVVVTIAASTVLLAPIEQTDQVRTAQAALLWVSNLLFAYGQIDYFGPAAESNLFLHTWSLGVEEQFYLAWPLLMLSLFGAFSRTRLPVSLRKAALGTAVVVGICFALGVLLTIAKPMWAYYLPVSRAWQFGVGALALFASIRLHAPAGIADGARVRLCTAIAGWCGLALILAAALLLDRDTAYPGTWSLLPTLGTALVLLAGVAAPRSGVGRLLSVRPLEWIGRRSYGWYLWHWPVLLLGGTLVASDSAAHTALLVAVSLVLAAVSFATIENPVRHAGILRARVGLVMGGSAVLMCSGALAAQVWGLEATGWSNAPGQARFVAVRDDIPFIYELGCDDWYHSAKVDACTSGDGSESNVVVVVGDSIVGQWVPALAEIYRKMGWRFVVVTKSACPMVDEQFVYDRIGRRYVECEAWREELVRQLQVLRPNTIIMGSSSGYPFDERAWTEGTARILQPLSASAERVVLVSPLRPLPFDGPNCVARAEWRKQLLPLLPAGAECEADSRSIEHDRLLSWLGTAAARFENVEGVDFSELVCPDGICAAQRNGHLVFRDSAHVTASFVVRLSGKLAAALSLTTEATGSAQPRQRAAISPAQ